MTRPLLRVVTMVVAVSLLLTVFPAPTGATAVANGDASVGAAPDVAMANHTVENPDTTTSDVTIKYHVSQTANDYVLKLINISSGQTIYTNTSFTAKSTSKESETITLSQGAIGKRTFVAVVLAEKTRNDPESAFMISCIDTKADETCPTVSSTSVTEADGTAVSDDVAVNTSLESFGMLGINVSSLDDSPKDLSDDGISTSTELEIQVTLENYDPVGLFGTANISSRDDGRFNWSTSTSGSTTTLTIYARPVEVFRNETIDVRRPGSWPTETATSTDRYGARLRMTTFDPPPTFFAGTSLSRSDMQNATVISDAQEYSPPTVSSNPARINFSVGSPHFETDGSTNNTGFYKAYMPDGYLDYVGVSAPSTLAGTYQNERKKLSVTDVPGGLRADADINYSSGTLTLVSDPSDTTGMTEAVSFNNTETVVTGAGNGNTAVEVVFNESLGDGASGTEAPEAGDFNVVMRNGSTVSTKTLVDRPTGDSQVILDVGGVNPRNVTAVNVSASADFTDLAGNTLGGFPNESVTTTSTTVGERNANRSAYRGEHVAIVGDAQDESVEIQQLDGSFVFTGSTESDSNVSVAETKRGGSVSGYWFLFNGNSSISAGPFSADTKLLLRDLDLNASVDDTSITTEDALTGNITANVGGRRVNVTLTDPTGDTETRWVTLGGTGEGTFDFGAQSRTGNYSLTVQDLDTGVTVETRAVTVSEATSGTADFGGVSVIRDERGDVVNLTVHLEDADAATVSIGGSDVGYQANTTVTDDSGDGTVVLQWNTYQAGTGDPFAVADSDDGYTVENEITDVAGGAGTTGGTIVDAGDYGVEVRAGGNRTTAGADTVATISLAERDTGGVTIWTAPAGTADTYSGKRAIYRDVSNGNLTEDTSIAGQDQLVLEVDATGIEGAIENRSGANVTAKWFAFTNASSREATLAINQTGADANTNGKLLNVTDHDAVDVVADSNNDTYFVVVDLGDVHVVRDDDADLVATAADSRSSPGDGDEFEANFTVLGNDDGLAERDQTVTTSWTFEGASATVRFGGETVSASPAANQTISGTTTVAAGTELTIRAASTTSGTPFLQAQDVRVEQARGENTWSADLDFSDVPQGTNFTVDVRRSGSSLLDEKADGEVVAPPQASVTFSNQDSDGSVVTVDSVTMNRGGFVAIHFRSAGGPVIGTSKLLSAGTTENVRIVLDDEIGQDRTLVAMPHLDADANNAFDIEADAAYTSDGAPVTDAAQINVVADVTPAPSPTPVTVTVTPAETPTPEAVTASPVPTPTPAAETIVRTATVEETVVRERTVTVTPEQTPGFGLAIALVALLAAALLAVRRRD